jgi:hypothetical protein
LPSFQNLRATLMLTVNWLGLFGQVNPALQVDDWRCYAATGIGCGGLKQAQSGVFPSRAW